MKITAGQLRQIIREVLEEDKSGKGECPDTGCIRQRAGEWRIMSNKTGKLWPQTYDTKKAAKAGLDAFHASRE